MYRLISVDEKESAESRKSAEDIADELDCVLQEFFVSIERFCGKLK